MLSDSVKERIAYKVIQVLYDKFLYFPVDLSVNRNAPFHEAFLNAFSSKLSEYVKNAPILITLSSWLHGLNTTLGQSFFEHTAHCLSNGSKRTFSAKYISAKQKTNVTSIITALKNNSQHPNLSEEDKKVFDLDTANLEKATDFTVDVYQENNDEIIAIELKSVRPNAGEMKGEKNKILEAKAVLQRINPSKKIKYYIGFPFDPLSTSDKFDMDKDRFMNSIIEIKKYFDPQEILLANEFWNFLSNDDMTMQQLITIINSIATDTFQNDFEFLNTRPIGDIVKYKSMLFKWFLFSELKLLEHDDKLKKKVINDKRLQNVYYQEIFKKGFYNLDRYNMLVQLL